MNESVVARLAAIFRTGLAVVRVSLVVLVCASGSSRSEELRFDSSTPTSTRRTTEAIMANASMAEQAEFLCATIKVVYYEAPGLSMNDAPKMRSAISQAIAKASDGKTLKEFLAHARRFPAIPKDIAEMLGFRNLDAVCN